MPLPADGTVFAFFEAGSPFSVYSFDCSFVSDNIRYTALFEIPAMSASSLIVNRRSSATALWIFFAISGVGTSFARPLRCSSWQLVRTRLNHATQYFTRPDHRDENCRLVDAPCCWPGGSLGVCRYKLLEAVDTRRYPRAENRVWSDQEDHEERVSKDRAASTCGPHSDSFSDTSRRRRSNCSTISRHLAEANLKCKRPFRALPLTPEHRQLRLQW
ncbi:hypothetical protein TNCV_2877851 [Trichonephila clavipes]|uniref:Transposase Tc1-like domain-containing protein n=1 Tax=Trichonephila clavipes TaxID=2585209 RepID=A0A8X6W1B0_TRICX|nr:hypothetical protein TNCV_2877851 [Trichonephila clavipes]